MSIRTAISSLKATALAVLLVGCAMQTAAPPQQADVPDGIVATASGSYLASLHAQRQRDVSASAEFSARALESDPNNFEFMLRTHASLVEAGRIDEAALLARRIVRINAGFAPAHLTLAVSELRAGNAAAARARLTSLPIQGVNRIVHPLMIAWIEMALDRPAAAVIALRPIQEVQGFRSLHDYHVGLVNELAGRFEDAEEAYRMALEGDGGAPPRLIEAYGGFLERRGRNSDARDLYLRFRAQNPESPIIRLGLLRTAPGVPKRTPVPFAAPDALAGASEALANLAAAFRQDNTIALALSYGRLALYLDDRDPATVSTVADILDQLGQRAEADKLYAKVDPLSVHGFAARLRLAENMYETGNVDGALRALDKLATDRTDRLEPLITMGNMLREKERFAEAAAAYGRAIERIGTPEPRHWSLFYMRGIAFERAKNWPAAERHFKRALELQPDQPDVLNYLAYTWVDKNENIAEAERMLRRAVEQRPNSGQIVDSLGWAYFRLGRFVEAVPLLERAVELLPEDAVILDHLGDAMWRVGRRLEATFQWRRSLLNKPEPDLKAEIEKKLREGMPPAVRPAAATR
ncbi:MAG: tetratricopeptide repeat protein [Alphaproteobacteria bacterium]|nr:tetratricopeptide repeat protein [Alphaproteobacteria bacterium]